MKRIGWLFLAILFLGCTRQGMSQEAQANPNQNLETQAPIRTVAPSDAPVPSDPPAPTETPVPAFYDRFVAGEPILTEDSYQSENVAVFLSCVEDTSGRFAKHLVYRVADIYLKDAASFRSAFTHEDFHFKYVKPMKEVAQSSNAIVAISGDYIRFRPTGLCLRNGELHRSEHDPERDVCVLYRDGVLETFDAEAVPIESLLSDPNVWQIIGFGPALLDENGQPKTTFHTNVGGHNPRAAIGYYEPGHYCFVLVEGRSEESDGVRMTGLSELMGSLGCKRAFNLDGGNTAALYFNGEIVNTEADRPRDVHDIFYIPLN